MKNISEKTIKETLNNYNLSRKKIIGTLGTIMLLSLTGCSKSVADQHNLNLTSEEWEEKITSENDTVLFSQNNISSHDLVNLRDDTTELRFNDCNFIDDLSIIPDVCPDLQVLDVSNCASVTDFSFLYDLDELEKVSISESAFVTEELVDYLDENDIEHDITDEAISNAKRVDDILKSIITDDMTDREKIQAITLYVMKNYSYDENLVEDSNVYPLSTMLNDEGGVCAGFSYLTNVLLNKVGIRSYLISNPSYHEWNLVEMDDKWYYLDPTNVNQGFISDFLLDKFNIGYVYMSDPSNNFFTPVEDYRSDKIVIPDELVSEISEDNKAKGFFEKNSHSLAFGAFTAFALFELGSAVSMVYRKVTKQFL